MRVHGLFELSTFPTQGFIEPSLTQKLLNLTKSLVPFTLKFFHCSTDLAVGSMEFARARGRTPLGFELRQCPRDLAAIHPVTSFVWSCSLGVIHTAVGNRF